MGPRFRLLVEEEVRKVAQVEEANKETVKLTGFALPSVEQVIDGSSESFGLFFAGKIQTNLTGLRGRRRRTTDD